MEQVENSKTKFCKMCRNVLSIEEFGLNSASPDGKRHICKKCAAKLQREYSAKKKKNVLCPNPDLHGFTSAQLIEELRARGYKGELHYTETKIHKIHM